MFKFVNNIRSGKKIAQLLNSNDDDDDDDE
jgi:hypothetical protein